MFQGEQASKKPHLKTLGLAFAIGTSTTFDAGQASALDFLTDVLLTAFCHTSLDFEKCNKTSMYRCIGIRNHWVEGLKLLPCKKQKASVLGI